MSQFDYTYNPVGTIATWTQQADSSTPVVNTLSYDGADQLTSCVQSGGATASNTYAYDPAGNRLSETTGSGTSAGQFNNLNQLTTYSNSVTQQPVAGSLSSSANSVTVNAVPATLTQATNFSATVPLPSGTNTLTVVSNDIGGSTTTKRFQTVTSGAAPTQLGYDANGNTLTDEKGYSYSWDALNRLTSITYPGGASTLFGYDGLSRRTSIIEKTAAERSPARRIIFGLARRSPRSGMLPIALPSGSSPRASSRPVRIFTTPAITLTLCERCAVLPVRLHRGWPTFPMV